MHNGHGSKYGFSKPLTIKPRDAIDWDNPSYDKLDVTDPFYGATASSPPGMENNDLDAIQRAINDATGTKATVYFPPGVYHIQGAVPDPLPPGWPGWDGISLVGKSNLRLLGANGAVIAPMPASNPQYLVFSDSGYSAIDVEINNLTFTDDLGDGNGALLSGSDRLLSLKNSQNLVMTNVTLNSAKVSALDLQSDGYDPGTKLLNITNHVTISNSHFNSQGVFINGGFQISIDNCTMDSPTVSTPEMLTIWQSHDISITRTVVNGLKNANVGRWIHLNGLTGGTPVNNLLKVIGGSNYNIYIGENRASNVGQAKGGGQDGEIISSEGNLVAFDGHDSNPEPSANYVHISGLPGWVADDIDTTFQDTHVVIAGGKGVGQVRRVVGMSVAPGGESGPPLPPGWRLILDSPWNVPPDNQSRILISHVAEKVVVYGNYLNGTTETAGQVGTGVWLFGNCHDWVVANNDISQVNEAVGVWGLDNGFSQPPVGDRI